MSKLRIRSCFAAMAILWSAVYAAAGERRYYNCILQRALSEGKDAVLMIEVEDGQVRRHALEIAGQIEGFSRMKSHQLKVDGNRLTGPAVLQAGTATEKVQLDVALDKGGTYAIAYGCPDAPRKVEGAVAVEEPKDAKSKRWVVSLQGALREGAQLALVFNFDRQAKTFEAQPASCGGYNRAQYPVDAARVKFDGTNLEGEVGITIMPDQWVPAHGLPVEGSIKLKASLDGKEKAGTYTAVFGIEKHRPGQVIVKPGSEAQLRELTSPILPALTPWRVYLVTAESVLRQNGQFVLAREGKPAPFDPAGIEPTRFRTSPLPPAQWIAADFDDRCWPRYQGDLNDFLGGWGTDVGNSRQALWPAQICLRSAFGISDPAKATDLKLLIECIGGAVVYVNGKEVGRGCMPQGEILPMTPAEDYPLEAYTADDGRTPLPQLTTPKRSSGRPEPEEKLLPRYNHRIRTITIPIPASALVKGRNSLAIGLHRSAIAGPLAPAGWSHVGFRQVKLTSASGLGAIPYAEATKGPRVWSASPVDQVTETLSAKPLIYRNWFWTLCWGRGMPVKGIQQGNPFDPVLPVKMTMPRNGVGSGQTVLSDPDALRGVSAILDPLKGPGGALLPASGVQIRFAIQHPGVHYCDGLLEKAPEGATTLPVWLIIQAPKDQPPGWYVSTLNLQTNGQKFSVPVQVLVSGLVLPDSKDFSGSVSMTHSPETVAKHYGAEMWSDAHLAKMAATLAMMGQVGNDTVHVPVLASNIGGTGKSGVQFGWQPMVRWTKTPQGLKADFSILEKYLDAYLKHCAPPKAISFYIWGASSAKEIADAYEGRRIPSRENVKYSPPAVLVRDPDTGTIAPTPVPAIGEEGSEKFWKPFLDDARALVIRRGWSERVIALGLGGDIRPGQKTAELVKEWAPCARWDFLSHFSGDPSPKDGKMIATGGMEMAMMEWPAWTGMLRLADFEARIQKPYDFLELPTDRWMHQEYSPPLIFRTMTANWGCIGRVGLDFWDARASRGAPRSTSFFSHIESLTIPGPDGAAPTVRFQMLREGIQDAEVKTAIVRAYLKLPDEARKPYRALLNELGTRIGWGNPFYLSQCELSHDWPAYVAQLHLTAAELAGARTEAKWESPPR